MPDVFASLQALKGFLNQEIAAQVPVNLRSEVRAAAKLLDDMVAEIDALPCLLIAEGSAMLALEQRALARFEELRGRIGESGRLESFRHRLAMPFGSLRALLELHGDLKSDAESVILGLQTMLRQSDLRADARPALTELLSRYYELFAAQASARLSWQSVFPLATTVAEHRDELART